MPKQTITVTLTREDWEALCSNRISKMSPIIKIIKQLIIDQDVKKYGLSSTNHSKS